MEEVRIKYVTFKFIQTKKKKIQTKEIENVYLILCRIERGVNFMQMRNQTNSCKK